MNLRVYDTLSRQKKDFTPVRPGRVGMYVCGPTVYKPSHVGHMVGPVIFDTVKRFLTYLGYQVTLVVNITDVDDKLIVEAARQKTTVGELAERVTADYCRNLERLGVTGVDHMPRATHHIGDILDIIRGLIDKGFAYPAAGDVYFDVIRDPDYGKLCNRDPEQLEAGARIEVSDKKRNPGDFALWKAAKPGEPSWPSPWGPGRPGWHIECSAMSMKLLGRTLDIHGGGLDLQFPHHENELAQSESYTGETFTRYWMHNGLMRIRSQSRKIKDQADGGPEAGQLEKMSKSLGNEIVVNAVLERHHPETLRFLLLNTHYRSPIEYSEDRLLEMRRSLDNFYRFFERYQRVAGESFYGLTAPDRYGPLEEMVTPGEFCNEVARLRATFLEAMADDFNTGGAIGVLNELLTALNRFADARQLEGSAPAAEALREFGFGAVVLRELSQLLGLFREPPAAAAANDQLVAGLVGLLIDLRAQLRVEGRKAGTPEERKKIYELADSVRTRMGRLGIHLEDRPGGTGWRLGEPTKEGPPGPG
jgi:cysteinyl-tRNA synthetase